MLNLLHPYKGPISNADVIQWARDRMIDERLDAVEQAGGDVSTDAAYYAADAVTPYPTLKEAMAKLEDDGVATFEK